MYDTLTDNLDNVFIGITFNKEPLSIKTLDNVQSLHLVVICKAFVLPHPFGGISSSLNDMKLSTMVFPKRLSNFPLGCCVLYRLDSALLTTHPSFPQNSIIARVMRSLLASYSNVPPHCICCAR